MVIEIHPDNDTEETTEFRHSSPSEPLVVAKNTLFRPRKHHAFQGTLDGKGETLGVRAKTVCLVSLVNLVCFVHRTRETRETRETRQTSTCPMRLWRRLLLTAHESMTGRASLAWRPSFEAGSTALAKGEWRSTVSPSHLPACRLGACALILRQLLPECRRNQSASRVYA